MDVVALGELLIDFTENGISSQGNPLFEANPGGAPCNVLAMLTKLGHKTAFIGKVGNDFFGKQLEQTIIDVGIDASGLQKDDDVHTTLALVHTYPDGDRDFSWLEGKNSQGKLKFFFEWINRSHDSHPVLSKCKPTNTFESIEDLLIYFDSPGFDKEHRELFSSKVRALWNQQQRRANLKDKKACNFVLSTSTIKNIKRLSVKYHLTQTEVIEIIIDSESKYEKYIKERISLHESMKKAINFDCPTL